MKEQSFEILIADDEPQILRVMRTGLPPRGFHVRTASSGEEALEELRKQLPDLVVLDLVLPGLTGFEVCRMIREFSQVPIIVLSAKGSEKDKVLALEYGADDYLIKPFGMNELIARIRAVLRRSAPAEDDQMVQAGEISIDTKKRKVLVGEKEIHLTPKEYEVLKYLAANPGEVIPHRALLKAVWGWQSAEQTEYLRVVVNQLRKKVEQNPDQPKLIVTVPWVGYKLDT